MRSSRWSRGHRTARARAIDSRSRPTATRRSRVARLVDARRQRPGHLPHRSLLLARQRPVGARRRRDGFRCLAAAPRRRARAAHCNTAGPRRRLDARCVRPVSRGGRLDAVTRQLLIAFRIRVGGLGRSSPLNPSRAGTGGSQPRQEVRPCPRLTPVTAARCQPLPGRRPRRDPEPLLAPLAAARRLRPPAPGRSGHWPAQQHRAARSLVRPRSARERFHPPRPRSGSAAGYCRRVRARSLEQTPSAPRAAPAGPPRAARRAGRHLQRPTVDVEADQQPPRCAGRWSRSWVWAR